MRILHLSEFHLRAGADGEEARESLRRMLADCSEVEGIGLVVASGDIADDGSPEA